MDHGQYTTGCGRELLRRFIIGFKRWTDFGVFRL
jgi:hypothetical protein